MLSQGGGDQRASIDLPLLVEVAHSKTSNFWTTQIGNQRYRAWRRATSDMTKNSRRGFYFSQFECRNID